MCKTPREELHVKADVGCCMWHTSLQHDSRIKPLLADNVRHFVNLKNQSRDLASGVRDIFALGTDGSVRAVWPLFSDLPALILLAAVHADLACSKPDDLCST